MEWAFALLAVSAVAFALMGITWTLIMAVALHFFSEADRFCYPIIVLCFIIAAVSALGAVWIALLAAVQEVLI